MSRCATCGNEYEHCFEVILGDTRHYFDCFECAIEMLAPNCAHCGCRVIGHGVSAAGEVYCCAHCAREASARAAGGVAHSGHSASGH